MKEFIIPIIASFVATLGFAFVYNIRGKNLMIASLNGAFSWAVYLACQYFFDSVVFSFFMAGVATALYAELGAYFFKTPATVYLIPGIIPLVPGLTVYRTVESGLFGELAAFGDGVLSTIKIGGAIALGLIFMSAFIRLVRSASAIVKTRTKG